MLLFAESGDRMTDLTNEEMGVFCKKKGFVFPNSDIYGGIKGFFDYGPLGSELKKNIKDSWWHRFVQSREDVVGIDGSIITHPKVWEASGHVSNFIDLMLECTKCGGKIRADHFIEDMLKIAADGMSADEINKKVKENDLCCPTCNGKFKDVEDFNLMFATNVGPKKGTESTAYLRPETAQLIFTDFRLVQETARMRLPFGIAQMGRAFRNEISPRDFLFRCREFEQMEIEYFIHPKKINDCPYVNGVMDHELFVYSAEMQEKSLDQVKMTIKDALDKKIIKTTWHAYWLAQVHKWFIDHGAKADNFRIRQHLNKEKSHYALDTWDLDFKFPFGYKELVGMANRTDFDLKQHMEYSKKDMRLFDDETREKVIPYVVAEPSLGVSRAFLVFMFDAYTTRKDEKGNEVVVLKLHPKLAPVKVGVFPLVNKLEEETRAIHASIKDNFTCSFDRSGSIGRRYARADETGIPFCVTYDFESRDDNCVTIRERDTAEQKRIPIAELNCELARLVAGGSFQKA